jgi:hypothetical protein
MVFEKADFYHCPVLKQYLVASQQTRAEPSRETATCARMRPGTLKMNG